MFSADRYWPSSSAASPGRAGSSGTVSVTSPSTFRKAGDGTRWAGTSNSVSSIGVSPGTRSRCSSRRTRVPTSGSSLLRVGP